MASTDTNTGYLEGQLLIAMPQMTDPRFTRTLIYMCAHSADGAMGLVVNKPIGSLTFSELMNQMGIEIGDIEDQIRVHFGGPVESSRGFVLHSTDYVRESTLVVNEEFALTATVDVLKSIAEGDGPSKALLALGYAGWSPGQLDAEIQANGWLHVDADSDLVFQVDNDDKWERAIAKVGIDLSLLSSLTGHA